MKKDSKIDTESMDMVQLISESEVIAQFGEANASLIATDQVITWGKFVLTDDKPNGNRQRIPLEEFDNIIRTGVYKPIKMATGEIKDGHEESVPLGVITNLIKEGNKIIALAALWSNERDKDVLLVKERVDSGKPVNVSWELLYGDSRDNNGVSDLLDIVVKAVTIVGIPAYQGRTQFLAVAAKKWSPAFISKLPDTSFLYVERDGTRYFPYRDEAGKIDPSRFQPILDEIAEAPLPQNVLKDVRHQVKKLHTMISTDASLRDILEIGEVTNLEEYKVETKELEVKISDLEAKLALANDTLLAKEKELTEALALAEQANTTVKTLTEEITPLRDFKMQSDEQVEKANKLAGIKAKFTGVGLERPDDYFATNADKLLGMDETGLEFMLQEMVAFKSDEKVEGQASLKGGSGIPNIQANTESLTDVKGLAAALRERNKK